MKKEKHDAVGQKCKRLLAVLLSVDPDLVGCDSHPRLGDNAPVRGRLVDYEA